MPMADRAHSGKRRVAERNGARRRRPSSRMLAGVRQWPHVPDVAGIGMIAAGLVMVLALFQPEGALGAPLSRFLTLTLGWLAVLSPVWLAAVGVLLISHRVSPRSWPWSRLLAAAGATVSLLGLAAMEAVRREGPFAESAGGGLFGRAVAGTLVDWTGAASTAILLGSIGVASLIVVADLHPAQVIKAVAWAVRVVRRAAEAGATGIQDAQLRINTHDAEGSGVQAPRQVQEPDLEAAGTNVEATDAALPSAAAVASAPARRPDGPWKPPPVTLFQTRKASEPANGHLREQARVIEETLTSFNIQARVLEVNRGPAVTQFGIEPAIGVPVSRVTARLNDLALRLGASPIRMEAPVPGRRLIGIEVPNPTVSVVTLREVLDSPSFDRSKSHVPLALGKDIAGKAKVGDLARMPHLLIAGATGSGKSVCINSIVACLLSQFTPDELQLLMIDPKMVELVAYNGVPHLRMPVVIEMERVVGTLRWATQEMGRRYRLFAAHSARNIDGYNRAVRDRPDEKPLPYLVLIIDELADLMMMAPEEVEKMVCRLAQLARATGIHLVVATQRPSVDVLTGLIKANFPTRIAFAVTSQVDSRVILDTVGAERLLGRGDMLFLPPDVSKPIRIQGAFVSDPEIESLVDYWRRLGTPQYDDADVAEVEQLGRAQEPVTDELYERAASLAQESGRVSVSFLQRRLGIGYPRAARLVDMLEERGVLSTNEDGRSRKVAVDE
ncbi:MAG: DNA translocase FtsK [Chloroflexi bacterium]|nr:DNA translocase FtsK [Chloroflexota bacterium]